MAHEIIRKCANSRTAPYFIDTPAAVSTLDEAIGALTLAYDAVFREAGTNQPLSHAFGSMRMAIRCLDTLRDELSEAKHAEVGHG